MIKLIRGNCLLKMKEIPSESISLVLTDPPYELGFMGKGWDSTGISNNVDMWKECLRVLKPGGHLLAFSGTRTYHRMTCAIEDAGFEIRDMVEWIYGSGFPKSLNIGKAVDKLQGNEREVIGLKLGGDRLISQAPNGKRDGNGTWGNESGRNPYLDKGNSEWEGWGTALKPAHEPICMARKPLSEKTVVENVLEHGTGGINIDESRVESNEDTSNIKAFGSMPDSGWRRPWMDNKQSVLDKQNAAIEKMKSLGRFSANLIHDGSEEVRECFPETIGNASRFFKSIIYQAKASKKDRGENNDHPTIKPSLLMEYLIKLASKEGQIILDPFMGSGTTGIACRRLRRSFIGIELDTKYFDISNNRIFGIFKEMEMRTCLK